MQLKFELIYYRIPVFKVYFFVNDSLNSLRSLLKFLKVPKPTNLVGTSRISLDTIILHLIVVLRQTFDI